MRTRLLYVALVVFALSNIWLALDLNRVSGQVDALETRVGDLEDLSGARWDATARAVLVLNDRTGNPLEVELPEIPEGLSEDEQAWVRASIQMQLELEEVERSLALVDAEVVDPPATTAPMVATTSRPAAPIPTTAAPAPVVPDDATWETVNTKGDPSYGLREVIHGWFGDLGLQAFVEAMDISWCESRHVPTAHRTTNNPAALTGDRGLFQINHTWDDDLIAAGIISHPSDLFDAWTNARAARHVYNAAGQSWSDWSLSRSCHGHR